MRVLFIGNSHTYVNDMPMLFAKEAKADGYDVEVTMISHPGWYLDQHNEWPEVRFNILFGHYDYVVAQEHAHPFGPVEKLYSGFRAIQTYINQAEGKKPKLVVYATWAPKRQPQVQAEMSAAHRLIAGELGALLAPVDEKWQALREREPDVELYACDGEHASPVGSALVARTVWATVKADLQA